MCCAGLVVATVLLAASGCRSSPEREELLLAELRTRTRELEETREELIRHRQLNQLYQNQAVPVWGGASFKATTDTPTYPLKEIALGTGTGGVDDDQLPGDESLMVMLVPKDLDGTAVKVPGQAFITALEVSSEGLKTPIAKWEVPAEQLRRTWKSGLLSSGYAIPLQWERPPTQPKIRVVVRFQTIDGKEFEADKDITVQLLPGVSLPPASGEMPVFPAQPGPVLPPPFPGGGGGMSELPPPGPAAKLLPPQPIR